MEYIGVIIAIVKMKIKHKIIMWLLIALVLFIGSTMVDAYNFRTVFNPFTGKLDYYSNENLTGYNVTADYFIGNGSLLTDIEAGNSSFNQSLTDSLYYNKSEVDNNLSNYILSSEESNLNVNSTTWWASVSGWVSNFFYKNGNDLDLNTTKLNKTIRDNSLNQTEGDSLYLNLSGTNANQNIDIGNYNITADWFKGLFDWNILSDVSQLYLSFNGSDLDFNETQLNSTIDDRGSVNNWANALISYVNLTSGTYNGSLINGSKEGYKAGDAICNAEFSGSHFCNEFEVINWKLRTLDDDAWVIAGGPKYIPASVPVNDCNGFTYDGTTDYLGNYFHFNSTIGGDSRALNCGTELKLACCTY